MENTNTANSQQTQGRTKFCKYCGQKIAEAAVFCVHCGCQVEELKYNAPSPVVINNSNSNINTNTSYAVHHPVRMKNKWLAFILCLFFGYLGVHKFYEGKVGMGILYLFTMGLFGIGWLVDCIVLLFHPNPYYV